jgi:xanthine dehydrogenase YagR molybdenum-binding subunit
MKDLENRMKDAADRMSPENIIKSWFSLLPGFFVNHDLAGYEVPVHADIPHQEVIFLDETDPMSSPMKAKGVAELGSCGVGAAVANAVYNATGVHVRDYPITLDKLLGQTTT